MSNRRIYWKVSSPHRSVYVEQPSVILALEKAESLGLMHPLVAVKVTQEEAYGWLSMEAQRA